MQYAIIHTETKVVKKLTTDSLMPVSTEESLIEADGIDLAGGPWKLEGGELKKPTQQEIDDSGVDEMRNALIRKQKQDNLLVLRDVVIEDKSVPKSIRDYFSAIKEL